MSDLKTTLGDIQSARLIVIKGVLFAVVGIIAALGIWLQNPDWRTALLLAICVWSCCRFYYFAFYVIEKYVDPNFKYAGLWTMILWLLKRKT